MLENNKNWLRSLKSFILYFDFVGPQFFLEHNNSNRHKTLEGALISTSAIVFLSVITFLFGKEIYERNNPIVSISYSNLDYSLINLSEFPLMFYISDFNGNLVSNFEDFYLPEIRSISMSQKGIIYEQNHSISIVDCRTRIFDINVQNEVNLELSKRDHPLFCLDSMGPGYFSNLYFTNNSTNLNLGFRLKCRVEGDSNCLLTNSSRILTILHLNSFIDIHNVNNPVISYMDQISIALQDTVYRRYYFRIRKDVFIYDNGWIFEEKISKEFIKLDTVIPDDLNSSSNGQDSYMIFLLTLESPNIKQISSRYYLKIQDLLAKIGGFTNATIILIRILSYNYLRFSYLLFIKQGILSQLNKENSPVLRTKSTDIIINSPEALRKPEKPRKTCIELNQDSLQINKEETPYIGEKRSSGKIKIHKHQPNHIKQTMSEDRKSSDFLNGVDDISKKDSIKINHQRAMQNEVLSDLNSGGTLTENTLQYNLRIKAILDEKNFGLFNYISAYLCCNRIKLRIYQKQMSGIMSVLDFTSFCKISLTNCIHNHYDSS